MPPSFPHAVFSPEDSLAVGGQVYTIQQLPHSIEGLKTQEDYPDISNEDLHDSVYSILARVLRESDPITTSVEKARIASSCSLFTYSPGSTPYENLSKKDITTVLKSRGITFDSRAKRENLLQVLKDYSKIAAETSGKELGSKPREEFLAACQSFCKAFIERADNS